MHRLRSIFSAAWLGVCFAAAGCSVSSLQPGTAAIATGNWQILSPAAQAGTLALLTGQLSGSGADVRALLHGAAAGSCAGSAPFSLAGGVDRQNQLTLSDPNFAGGTLTLSGTLGADGRSLTDATLNVTGGACAMAQPAQAQAQNYQPITGTYTGSFSDPNGQVIAITASLTQTPASDANGDFELSGSGTFPNNPCFSSPVAISNSQVSGGSFTLTYTDSATTNSVNASGTFSPDGTQLTVTSWTLSGPCGPDTGTGLLSR